MRWLSIWGHKPRGRPLDSPLIGGSLPSHWSASSFRSWVGSAILMLSGIGLLFTLAVVESRWLDTQPWSRAIWTEDYPIRHESALKVWSRQLSVEQSLGDSEFVRILQEDLMIDARAREAAPPTATGSTANPLETSALLNLDFLPRAWLLMLDLPPSELESVLESGRLPVAGAREVLAGPLLSSRELVIDGQTFTVTGTLRAQASGFTKVYVLPHDPTLEPFFQMGSGKQGSFLADAEGKLESLIPELIDTTVELKPAVHGGPVQTRRDIAWGIWFALVLVASGASMAFMACYRHASRLRVPLVAQAMQEITIRPRLAWGLHFFFFGAFFGAMAIGLMDTELNYFFTQYASHEFKEGGLKYVGDAYASGSMPRAAHATFFNNFLMQTLVLSTGVSLIPPFFLGLLKIMFSFIVVGFAMAPLWTETAAGMTYHAGTLGLELPPYILAGFGAIVWAQRIWRFIWSPVRVWYLGEKAQGENIVGDAAIQLPRGIVVLSGCTIVSGVFLYAAAWYEAVTLILFR